MAKWLRRGSAKPLSPVRIRPSPPPDLTGSGPPPVLSPFFLCGGWPARWCGHGLKQGLRPDGVPRGICGPGSKSSAGIGADGGFECRGGETGIRSGLKIRRPERDMRVRAPPPAPATPPPQPHPRNREHARRNRAPPPRSVSQCRVSRVACHVLPIRALRPII